jgi:malonate-semialdehyde dehydrogenase (acetylating)/methylmalonate-semialdehyde dehydrogenase
MTVTPPAKTPTCPQFVSGRWLPSASEETLDVFNPATGEVISKTPLASSDEVEAAVAAAKAAFPSWSKVPPPQRARYLFRYRELLVRHSDEIARIVSREHGKTVADAKGSLQRGIETVEFACGIPSLMMGECLQEVAVGIDTHSIRQPLGVCLGVTPFNFPVMIPLWMFPLALACGNTFVLKPSEKVPQSATRLVELLQESGIPEGVMNLVHGAASQVEQLIDHPDVRVVSIVGSSEAAAAVYARAAARGKRVQALGGAKNHLIVMPDADLELATEAIIQSAFGSTGQRCMAGAVVDAVGSVGDEIVERIRERADALRLGPGDDEATEMGPLVNRTQRDRAAGYIELGQQEGAKVVLDGRSSMQQEGFFLGPTILDEVKPGSRVSQDEIFGPVLSVIRPQTLDEALAIVNASPKGNGAAIFTRDAGTARRFCLEVEAGMVGVNVGVPAPMAFFPFAGWKGSFFGDLHATGKDGVRFYTEQKVITSRV